MRKEKSETSEVEVKKEEAKESSKKRPRRTVKMMARKRSKRQKTSANLEEEEEKLKTFLTIVPVDEEKMDYDTLDKKYTIVDWEYQLLGRTEARDIEVVKLIRAVGSLNFHGVSQDSFR